MCFTIRHLLWFTLLAAVGCWWWLPSANDAELVQERFTSPEQLNHPRFTTLDDALSLTSPIEVDFARRDIVIFASDPNNGSVNAAELSMPAQIRSRGRGCFVFSFPLSEKYTTFSFGGNFYVWIAIISVVKNARAFQITRLQANLIDGGMAAGLLSFAIGSLFIGRKRQRPGAA